MAKRAARIAQGLLPPPERPATGLSGAAALERPDAVLVTVGVVSDTHLPDGSALPRALVEGLRQARVTHILHCGDHTSRRVVTWLERIAPVDAVAGNCDDPKLVERWGYKKILTIAGVRIGLVHGHEGPRGEEISSHAYDAFGDQVDVICFGHSHRPSIEQRGSVLMVNPGSPTGNRDEQPCSFALLRLQGGTAEAELHRCDGRSS